MAEITGIPSLPFRIFSRNSAEKYEINTEYGNKGIRNSAEFPFFNELLVFYVYLLNVSKLAHPWYRSILKFPAKLQSSVRLQVVLFVSE